MTLAASQAQPSDLDAFPIDSAAIDALQRDALKVPPAVPPAAAGLYDLVAANHAFNRLLWQQEDEARRLEVPDAWIVQNKRAIDRYNQKRNDAIEAIDECLLAAAQVPPRPGAWMNSETAGSIIDRLSINLLKLHHMGLQQQRNDVKAEHRELCERKCARLREQRADLLGCLDRLLQGLRDGSCYFRIYRQFKMYNDPALNPCLHGKPQA